MPPTSRNPAWLAARAVSDSTAPDVSCPRPVLDETGAPLFGDSGINLHRFMIYVSAACLLLTTISSVFLSWRHLHRYTSPQEQRQILRIVNMPVMYAIFNFLALTFVLDYLYLEPLAGIYEAFAVAALFLLTLEYVAPDGTDREKYFDNLELRDRRGRPQSGGSLKWFQRTWSTALMYPVLKTVLVVVQIITQYFGVYCENSFSFHHAHLYLDIIDFLFVGGALGATIAFYRRLETEIAPIHKARAKIFSFIGILVFQIIQGLIFHLMNGKLFHPTKTATYNDINFGIASFMTCIEAVIFSIIFHWSFGAGEYKEGEKMDRFGTGAAKRTKTWRAILDALNLADIVAGSLLGFQLLFVRVRSRYGGSRLPDHQTAMEPLSRPGRNLREDGAETYYNRGYSAPPYPAPARDPSPGAAYGKTQAHRADNIRPDYSRAEYSAENQPLQVPRDMTED